MTYSFQSTVWLYTGEAAWYFLTIPREYATEIKERYGKVRRGWGSIPVTVKIGKTSWKTSIFPYKESGSYILPLKAEVRKKEDIQQGDKVTYSISFHLSLL